MQQGPNTSGQNNSFSFFRGKQSSSDTGVSTVYFENSIGVFGDSILIDVSKIFIDGKLLICPCGKPAIGAVIKHGKCTAYCLECAPRR